MFGHVVWCNCTINLVPLTVPPDGMNAILDDMVMNGQLADGGTCPECGEHVKVAMITGTAHMHNYVIRMTRARTVL